MPPAEYLATSYYERWLFGLERLLDERGMVSPSWRSQPARVDDPAPPLEDAPDALDAATSSACDRAPDAVDASKSMRSSARVAGSVIA